MLEADCILFLKELMKQVLERMSKVYMMTLTTVCFMNRTL